MKTKRLRQGVDWHGWAWEAGKTWPNPGELFLWAETEKSATQPTESGKWVRVKFVKIDGRAAKKASKK